jgi:parallel beta-helix repeat protein
VLLARAVEQAPTAQGTVVPARDDTRIERSCRVALGEELLVDAQGDGALQIVGDGITVELTGTLRGAPAAAAPDTFSGVGIVVTGKHVTLRGARVAGYKVAIHARGADGLVLEDCDVSGNFRQHLKSTKEKESDDDWLDPHHNDAHEWFTNYGAGIYVERASGVTVRRCRAHAGQNGLVLERCDLCMIHDNDFSYLSGWGIALWRSSDNHLFSNACNFCIRGYSHGVYNRGQDSAGILLFEQCSRNQILGNSANYCGDGFFAFAGQEALGSTPPPSPDFNYRRRGNDDNVVFANEFRCAAAHGLELTFSFGNRIEANTITGNAICGIWAGYSHDTLIARNKFVANGDAGYGLERGGVNIEHGQGNRILDNDFARNACGVHLWWDADEGLAKLPWVAANGFESRDNCVQRNRFDGDTIALHLRDTPGTRVHDNTFMSTVAEQATEGSASVDEGCSEEGITAPSLPSALLHRSVLEEIPGRETIRLDEWGPIEPP